MYSGTGTSEEHTSPTRSRTTSPVPTLSLLLDTPRPPFPDGSNLTLPTHPQVTDRSPCSQDQVSTVSTTSRSLATQTRPLSTLRPLHIPPVLDSILSRSYGTVPQTSTRLRSLCLAPPLFLSSRNNLPVSPYSGQPYRWKQVSSSPSLLDSLPSPRPHTQSPYESSTGPVRTSQRSFPSPSPWDRTEVHTPLGTLTVTLRLRIYPFSRRCPVGPSSTNVPPGVTGPRTSQGMDGHPRYDSPFERGPTCRGLSRPGVSHLYVHPGSRGCVHVCVHVYVEKVVRPLGSPKRYWGEGQKDSSREESG